MGRKKRQRYASRRSGQGKQFTRVNSNPETAGDRDLTPSSLYGSFKGAMPSEGRGYVYFPNLDSEREVDSWSRVELAKRACALYNEVGFVRGTINGIARMVCGTGIMPQALTANEDWNDRIEKLFFERAESRNTFHLARKFSFSASQRAVMRGVLKIGDVLAVLARNENDALRVGIYEGGQIGNGTRDLKGWVDGVLPDEHRAALKYRLLNRAEGKTTHVDVPAEHCLFIADYERIGQLRGLTCLYHAVNRLLDRGEILAAVTKGIKVANQHGYVIETDKDSPGPSGGPGALAPRPRTIVQTSNGPMTMEKFLNGGGEIEELKPGQSFKIVHDQRPHPNVMTHLDGLVRDIALGTGFHSEVLWNVSSLGGANTRFVMASAQGAIEEKQEWLIESYCAPYYIAFVADAIANGEIEYVPDWYAHGWLTPGRMTVDFGRDGKLHIEQYKQGLITLKTLYGYRGEEWKRQIQQYLAERAFMKMEAQKHGLTLQEAFPNFYGTNVGAQPSAAEVAESLETSAVMLSDTADRLEGRLTAEGAE